MNVREKEKEIFLKEKGLMMEKHEKEIQRIV